MPSFEENGQNSCMEPETSGFETSTIMTTALTQHNLFYSCYSTKASTRFHSSDTFNISSVSVASGAEQMPLLYILFASWDLMDGTLQ